jgi:uncharacterized protein
MPDPTDHPRETPKPAIRRRFTRRNLLKALGGLTLLGAGVGAYATLIEVHRLVVERITIPIPGLAARWHGRSLVQLSDFHAGRTALSHIDRALRMALDLQPDFLLITGDFVDSPAADVDALCQVLRPIATQVETLGVTGNHDFGRGFANPKYADSLCAALAAAGVRMLRNAVYQPHPGPGELAFAGVEDLWAKLLQPATLAHAPPDASVIVLSHNPDSYEDLDRFRFHLMLSGHTHGGQVCIPFYGPPLLPVQHKERAAGLFHLTPTHSERALYVNRGVGYLRRIRLFCPPEVTCLTLQNPAMV